MNIYLTYPVIEDLTNYHNLISEPNFQSEFIHYRNRSLNDTREELESWIEMGNSCLPSFFRFIKLSHCEDDKILNNSNSKLIGFFANTPSGTLEGSLSGFEMLLNFGISQKYENKGIMTMAVELLCDYLKNEIGFTIITTHVKMNNIASQKVLNKCGFDLVRDQVGKTYVKALNIDEEIYKKAFNL
ncbi:MAG TPA: GNAT family protein [Vicingus sp.]|nr:GNAT family protein [Vicingus sp.]HRP59909.1 GNAT family protein [Vicingus sp.]